MKRTSRYAVNGLIFIELLDTIDFLFKAKRNASAAKSFFRKAIKMNSRPAKVTAALSALNKDVAPKIIIRQIKYLNNIAQQDHRFIKKRTKPMLGFKSFSSAKGNSFWNRKH